MSSALAFRVSFAHSTFQDLDSHLAFKPAEVEILSKTLGIEDGKKTVCTFTALDTPAFEDLVPVVKFGAQSGRLGRLCDAVRFLQEPVLQPAPASPPVPSQHSQTVAQVAEAVREVKASTSQRVRVCDHLDPMDKLEVEQPDADQQEFWRTNYAKLKGGSPHELCVDFAGLWATRAEGALLHSSSQTC